MPLWKQCPNISRMLGSRWETTHPKLSGSLQEMPYVTLCFWKIIYGKDHTSHPSARSRETPQDRHPSWCPTRTTSPQLLFPLQSPTKLLGPGPRPNPIPLPEPPTKTASPHPQGSLQKTLPPQPPSTAAPAPPTASPALGACSEATRSRPLPFPRPSPCWAWSSSPHQRPGGAAPAPHSGRCEFSAPPAVTR